MTFYDAVQWFKGLGAEVEPGPRCGEVSLIWTHDEAIQTQVVPDTALGEMAEISQRAHLRNNFNGCRGGGGCCD